MDGLRIDVAHALFKADGLPDSPATGGVVDGLRSTSSKLMRGPGPGDWVTTNTVDTLRNPELTSRYREGRPLDEEIVLQIDVGRSRRGARTVWLLLKECRL